MNSKQAKNIPITDFLLKLGIIPVRDNDKEAWYHSPISGPDNTPSFKVNKQMNAFHDFSSGEKGTIIDLGLKLFNCSISELLKKLEEPNFSFRQQEVFIQNTKTKLLQVKPIRNIKLISYNDSRGIPIDLLTKYCDEIYFTINNKKWYAIGFKNKEGGYEWRNSLYKGCISPKEIRLIENEITTSLCIFEGFYDFLSFIILKSQFPIPPSNFLILNSASMIKKAIKDIEPYQALNLFFDNDECGINLTKTIKNLFPQKEIIDWSTFYKDYNDLNDFLIKQK